ncbi:MAG TPA: uroporphyrinogen-III synthase [Longimicrobiales bacterium]|nr:uroporphyrinogen-III synthase [Longimicrobiales bacterium]
MTGRLAGKVVATTRQGEPDDPLARALRAEGAEVRTWPTVSFGGPRDAETLHAALARKGDYAWVIFTSPRAVAAASAVATWREGDGRVAAVGEATSRALAEAGWPVHLTGAGDGARGLVGALGEAGCLDRTSVLFLAGSLAMPTVEEGLSALGARVHRVEAYTTQVDPPDGTKVRADLRDGVAAVLFASPSAVRGLSASLAGDLGGELEGVVAVALGATTAQALSEAGVGSVATADVASMQGMVEACVQALDERR